VCAFQLPHALHIGWQFSESSGISNTLLSLGFGILLLRLNLLAFRCWFCGLWDWPKEHVWYLSFSWIISYLLVFSQIVLCCTVHHRCWVCSCCSQILWIVHTMTDFGVIFERIPLMCDNISAISVAKNPVFHKKMRHVERRHHFLRDHIEKGDIEMRYIDTERQLANIFTKPLDSSRFAYMRGGNWSLPSIWLGLRGSWCFFLYIVYFTFLLHFLYTRLSHFASPVLLTCICLIMLITMLGWVVMRCKTLLLDHAR
jgi:hypothetical protein